MTIAFDLDKEIWDHVYSYHADQQTQKQLNKKNENEICCPDAYTAENEGYIVCVKCGVVKYTTVLDDNIFGFSNGENNMYLRSFGSELYPVSSQSTQIAGSSKLSRLQSWSSMPYNERVIWEISNELKARLSEHFSPRVINDTLVIYKNFYEKSGIFRGDNKKGFVAVCVYIAASQSFASVTPKEISELLDVDLKVMYRCIQKYSEIMKDQTSMKKASDFLSSFSNKIGLSFKVRKPVVKILEVVEKYQLLGGTIPQNVCVATIAFVCKELGTPLDYKLLTKEFSISMSTLERIVGILVKEKQQIFRSIKSA